MADPELLGEGSVRGKAYGMKGSVSQLHRFIELSLSNNAIIESQGGIPTTLMIWGEPGIGKTQVCKDLGKQEVVINKKTYNGIKVVHIPLAMIEEMGDIHGLPEILPEARDVGSIEEALKIPNISEIRITTKEGKTYSGGVHKMVGLQTQLQIAQITAIRHTTTTAPPAWVPSAPGPGVIILDDYNRAPKQIITGTMQLVLDHKTINWALPPGWTIICTGNPEMSDKHFVQYMDVAQITRLEHFTLVPDALQWASWAEANGVDSRVSSFVLKYKEKLCQGDRVNPRTYTILGQKIKNLQVADDDIVMLASATLDEATVASLLKFIRNELGFCPEPLDILDKYKTDKTISTELAKVASTRNDIITLASNRVAAYILGRKVNLTEKQKKNFATFLLEEWFPADLRYALCKILKENESIVQMVGENEQLLKAVAECITRA